MQQCIMNGDSIQIGAEKCDNIWSGYFCKYLELINIR